MDFKQSLLVLLVSFCLISCANSRKLAYFNDIQDKTFLKTEQPNEILIAPNDILSVRVSSLNPEASALYNLNRESAIRTTTATGANVEGGGYLVSSTGFIQIPNLGKIKAAGLTKQQLESTITQTLLDGKLLKNPSVEIRFLNYEVTILGEVGRPTVITVPNEKISMLKAIGLAGDLTIFGKRNNVLLIRQEKDRRITRHVDLTSPDFFNSPYYYLQPNDIVYVQPNRARATQATMWPQLVPILLTALSVTIIVLDRVFR